MATSIIQRLICTTFSVIFNLILCYSTFAQVTTADTSNFAFLPAVSYDSDLGIIGGGVASWFTYKNDISPYYSYTTINSIFSTNGLASIKFFRDKPRIFGTKIRQKTELSISRFLEDTFYGIGNYGKINSTDNAPSQYYKFKSFYIDIDSDAQVLLKKINSKKQLFINFIFNVHYETPWDNNPNQLIMIEKPTGIDGGFSSIIGIGLTWEARDHEIHSKKGTYLHSKFEFGDSMWGSEYNLRVIENDIRTYTTFFLVKDITFATRLFSRFTNGKVPYWQLSSAGGNESLRGYESKRFMDDNLVLLNTELRTWLFKIPESNTQIGGSLFIDTGRTFANEEGLNVIKNDLKTTIGLGGLASLFTKDFIIRVDVGFSKEGYGIYLSTGYMF